MHRRMPLLIAVFAIIAFAGIALGQAPTSCGSNGCVYLPAIQLDLAPTATPTNTPKPVFPLINGNFEQGRDVGWVSNETSLFFGVTQGGARTGSWFADIGGSETSISIKYIAQPVTITAAAPYLAYWHEVESKEFQCTYDVGYASFDGQNIDQIDDFCASRVHGYRKRTIDLRAHIGQTGVLEFGILNDSTFASYWHIDDVSFRAKP